MPDLIKPMLAYNAPDTVENLLNFPGEWAFETKHDGVRIIARNDTDDGKWLLQARSGRIVTDEYKLWLPDLPPVVLDGEAVVLKDGVSDFNAIQNKAVADKVEFFAFDVIDVQGKNLRDMRYDDRRKILTTLGNYWLLVPEELPHHTGAEALQWAKDTGHEGVIAKDRNSTYQEGKRVKTWLKSKVWKTADVVLGGWKRGNGRRSGTIGNIMMGVQTPLGLAFCGKVGTGFTDAELARLQAAFEPLTTTESPFTGLPRNEERDAVWLDPVLTAEVQYQVVTVNGHLRHPSWRGLR